MARRRARGGKRRKFGKNSRGRFVDMTGWTRAEVARFKRSGVRWGHIRELVRSTRVGTPAWYRRHRPIRLRKLSAWRAMHTFADPPHPKVRWYARRKGKSLSSNLTVTQMIAAVLRANISGYFHRPERLPPDPAYRRPKGI